MLPLGSTSKMTARLGGLCSQTILPFSSSSSRRLGPLPYSKSSRRCLIGSAAEMQGPPANNIKNAANRAEALMDRAIFIGRVGLHGRTLGDMRLIVSRVGVGWQVLA